MLTRTFKQNCVSYIPDGTGRDRYIVINNGGFYHNYKKDLSPLKTDRNDFCLGTNMTQHNKSPSVKAPSFHYYADGLGRDKYIAANSGGLFYETKPLLSYKLTDFLRKNDSAFNSPRKKNLGLTKIEIKYNKLLRIKEKNMIQRLYSNEKKKCNKHQINPLNCLSSDNIATLNNKDNKEGLKKSPSFYLPKCLNNKIKIKLKKLHNCFTPRSKNIPFENNKNESNFSFNNFNNQESKNNIEISDLKTLRYDPNYFIKKKKIYKSLLFPINNNNISNNAKKEIVDETKNIQNLEKNSKPSTGIKKPKYNLLNVYSNLK